ncbi:hypothetical protein A5664_11565 [Mycolicibacterium fortuitum]|nr:hypothetical protein A5664_11565 [Mycolicibacterium fortuitum]
MQAAAKIKARCAITLNFRSRLSMQTIPVDRAAGATTATAPHDERRTEGTRMFAHTIGVRVDGASP